MMNNFKDKLIASGHIVVAKYLDIELLDQFSSHDYDHDISDPFIKLLKGNQQNIIFLFLQFYLPLKSVEINLDLVLK